MIKQRIVVHIALNAKGDRVGALVSVCGRLIPFSCPKSLSNKEDWRERSSAKWMGAPWMTLPSLAHWKRYEREVDAAVRFQRVMLIGGEA